MRKVFETCISLLIILTATAYVTGQEFASIQGMIYKFGILILFLMALNIKPLRWVTNYKLNLIPALVLVSSFFLPKSLYGMVVEPFIYLVMGITLVYLVANYVENFDCIINGICWTVVITAIMVALQASGNDPLCYNDSHNPNTSMVGLFGYKYVFGVWMAIATPILWYSRRFLFAILSFVLTVCSLSWACIGLMMSALVFTTWFYNKKIFIVSVLSALIVGGTIYGCVLLKPDNPLLTFHYKLGSRIEVEKQFLRPLVSRPLTGWGLSSFQHFIGPSIVNNKNSTWGTCVDAWNQWLETGIECGIPMIILLGWIFVDGFKRFLKKINPITIGLMGSLIIIPFGMMFHTYFIHYSLATLILCLVGWYEKEIQVC